MTRRQRVATAVVVVLTVAAAVVFAAFADATGSATNGEIAFQRYRLSDDPLWAEIFVARSDGSAVRRLTHPGRGVVDGNPDWAPGGGRVAFDRCVNRPPLEEYGWCTVWVVESDGGRPTRLSCSRFAPPSSCAADSRPSFTADGRGVLVVRESGGGRQDALLGHVREQSAIVELDLAGRTQRIVAKVTGYRGRLSSPAPSPDGRWLAYIRVVSSVGQPKGGRALLVARADGGGERRLTAWTLELADKLAWSPDGTRILFRGGRGALPERGQGNLFTIRRDGTELTQLTHFRQQRAVLRVGSYSPDGRSIVFATTIGATKVNGTDLPDVFIMAADGTEIRPVTRVRNWDGTSDWGSAR